MKVDDIKRQPILLMFAVIIVIILLVGIFRTIAPYLSLGFGAYAHIGDVRGAISFETFENQGELVIFTRPGCPFCDTLKEELSKEESKQFGFGLDGEGNMILPSGVRIIDTSIESDLVPSPENMNGVPTIRFYKTTLTAENKDGDNTGDKFFVELSGDKRTAADIKAFLDSNMSSATPMSSESS